MTMVEWAREYDELPPGEQSLFSEAIRRLLAEGLLWREEESDYRLYTFLRRREQLVRGYLQIAGWELRHDERTSIFHVVHHEGAHRRRLKRDTTIWLLLVRLIYAEQRESMTLSLARHPTISVGDLYNRLTEFFPGQNVTKKTSFDQALRVLQNLKLVRAATGGRLNARNLDQLIELLPTLEIAVPAPDIATIADRLADFDRSSGSDSEDDDDEE